MRSYVIKKTRDRAVVVVRPVESDDELSRSMDLMAKSHRENYFTSMEWLEKFGRHYPGFRREHTRIALQGNEMVGALRLTTETVRLGEARLKMGGLGWVTTAPDHRRQGVCTALMEDAQAYMQAHGYHVSMLFGIPNFYHRFGYATTLADYAVVLRAKDLRLGRGALYKARDVRPFDIRALQRIHRRNDANVTCSLVREAAHLACKWAQFKGAQTFTDRHGKVVGYMLARPVNDALRVYEVGIADETVCESVLAACADQAKDGFRGHLEFFVAPEHPFAHYLTRFASAHEMRLEHDSGGMLAFVDVSETLETMIPEWEYRLGRSAAVLDRCEATLLVDRRPFRIRANRGAIDVAQVTGKNKMSLSRRELLQLLTGYVHFDDVFHAERRMMAPDAKRLLGVIFPKRNPYVNAFDRF